MRREWQNLESFAVMLMGVWLIGGMIGFGIVASLNEGPHGEGIHGPGVIALYVWIGPPLLVGVAFAFASFLACARDCVPMRVVKPVTEDLREARKRGAA